MFFLILRAQGDTETATVPANTLWHHQTTWKLSFSRQVMSDSLQLHGLKCARLLCPTLSPGVCSNSCPLSRWYYLTISSSVVPFSSCLQSFPASGSFPMSHSNIYMGSRKMYRWMYLQGRNREADVENRLVDTAGEGEGGTNWERTETYTLSYVKRIASEKLLYKTGISARCSMQLRGVRWDGGWEEGSRRRGYMYTYGWSKSLYSKNQHNIVKPLSSN